MRSASGRSGVWVVVAILAVGTTLAVVAKGCGGRKAMPPPPPLEKSPVVAPAPAPTPTPAPGVVEGKAVLRGRVTYGGQPSAPRRIPVNKDNDVCECAPGDPKTKLPYKLDESLVVDPASKGIAHAVVWVKGVKGGPARPEVVVDQRGCVFVPHVALLTPGGKLTVLNPDRIAHNYHAFSKGKLNPTENLSIAKHKAQSAYPAEGVFGEPEFIRVACDVHDWMGMWVAVVENGFCAVTDAEGRFSILGLAPGTYTLGIWQETLAREPVHRLVTVTEEGAEVLIVLGP